MLATEQATFTFIATSDISAKAKGRAVASSDFSADTSVGWVPANLGIGPLGYIVDGIPFCSEGDLRLQADSASQYHIAGLPGRAPFSVCFADTVMPDGTAWSSCARSLLKETLQLAKDRYGLTFSCSFEHEFVEKNSALNTHPFSFENFLQGEPLGSTIFSVLSAAGVEPECWLPEYAPHQYELTLKPTDPVSAADRAILLREVVKESFKAAGREVTFSPVAVPDGGGTGVHVHYGIYGEGGEIVAFDPERPGRQSELAARFNAGVVKYAPEMTALFAPLLVSYQRLRPNNWSVAKAFCGLQNREALVRICPTNEIGGRKPDRQYHFEFRGGDVGANPWTLVTAILRAGLAGLEENLDPVKVYEGGTGPEIAAEAVSLPGSLKEALARFEESAVVRSWFSEEWVQTFLAIKRNEIESLSSLTLKEQCEAYANLY
ncbi:glutamine synthetase [Corynebacterium lizhenjunii]|uniref:Glutamine synthetase n=1 Tax=Corynebacterium lizhenjunii TaxID=2709394 RepID=A0A7T0PA99_9CORY|nr:glutamine synthetase family protein [Corynebacterium lizhenjunii]QPK78781.1 glutamine synthetase [Corynebacterium lizhenjunii]